MRATILVLAIALSWVQLQASPVQDQVQGSPQVRSAVSDVLNTLLNIVQAAINDALGSLNNVLDTFGAFSTGVVSTFSTQMNGLLKGLLAQVHVLEIEALSAGVNVTECLLARGKLFNLSVVAADGVQQCFTDAVHDGTVVVQTSMGAVNDSMKVVTRLFDRLEDCSFFNIFCATGVLFEATRELTELPAKIFATVEKTVQDIAVLQTGLSSCAAETVNNFTTAATEVTNEILTCIRSRLPRNPSEADPVRCNFVKQ